MSEVKLLTQEQVDALPDGVRVWIRWSGGNGPHLYTIIHANGLAWAKEAVAPVVQVGKRPLTEVSFYSEAP